MVTTFCALRTKLGPSVFDNAVIVVLTYIHNLCAWMRGLTFVQSAQ